MNNHCCNKCFEQRNGRSVPVGHCNNKQCICHKASTSGSSSISEGDEGIIEIKYSLTMKNQDSWQDRLNWLINGHLTIGKDGRADYEWLDENDQINMRKDLKVFIRNLLKEEQRKGREGFYNDLDSLLVNGNGGGNWRRLIMQLKGKYGR